MIHFFKYWFLSVYIYLPNSAWTCTRICDPNTGSAKSRGQIHRPWLRGQKWLCHRVVVPARQTTQAGWPVRQPYAGVYYIPQSRTKNWATGSESGYETLHIKKHFVFSNTWRLGLLNFFNLDQLFVICVDGSPRLNSCGEGTSFSTVSTRENPSGVNDMTLSSM
jgi:hypothetical protein